MTVTTGVVRDLEGIFREAFGFDGNTQAVVPVVNTMDSIATVAVGSIF